MPVKTLTINGQMITSPSEHTVLDAARENGIKIPTLCHLSGVGDVVRAGCAWSRLLGQASWCPPA